MHNVPCTLCNINQFLLTCDPFSDNPFVKVASEEFGGLESVSDWLTSGTNSFYNMMDSQISANQRNIVEPEAA